jgi:hypothetical protein
MSYQEGFEDAAELCLDELKKANDKVEAAERIKDLLELVKQNKFDRIRHMLGALRR